VSGTQNEDDKNKNKNEPDPGGQDDNEHDEGEGTGDTADGDGNGGDDKGPKSLEEATKLIEKLRKENAKNRIKSKERDAVYSKTEQKLNKVMEKLGITDESEDPETKLAALKASNEQLEVRLTINQIARENGITPEQDDFFEFLLAKEFEKLGEGEEIDDETIEKVVAKTKGASGKKQSSTGVESNPPGDKEKGDVTVDQFIAMSLAERGDLYGKNPALYEKLMKTAREKRLLR
jgi:hypothetical protein